MRRKQWKRIDGKLKGTELLAWFGRAMFDIGSEIDNLKWLSMNTSEAASAHLHLRWF